MIETFDGDDWPVVEKRRMSKSRTIDRRNYCYEESIMKSPSSTQRPGRSFTNAASL